MDLEATIELTIFYTKQFNHKVIQDSKICTFKKAKFFNLSG